METEDKLSFGVEWNYKTVSGLIALLVLPNILGMINIGTVWGFKLHFFQAVIFIASILYGPKGGLLSGLIGSAYSAFIMHNPYIVIGNAILGFFTGLFIRNKMHTIIAVALAYAIQLPWLVLTDYYLIGLPMEFIHKLVIALAMSNLIWAVIAHYTIRR